MIRILLLILIVALCAGCIQNEVTITISVRDKMDYDGLYAVVTQEGEAIGVASKEIYNSIEPGYEYLVVLGEIRGLSGKIGIIKVVKEVDNQSEGEK